jgi:hypothetical protein
MEVEVVLVVVLAAQGTLILEILEILLLMINQEIPGILIILPLRDILLFPHLRQNIEAEMIILQEQHSLLWIILEVLYLHQQQLMRRGIREDHLWILNFHLEEEKDIEIYHLGNMTTYKNENTMAQNTLIHILRITGYITLNIYTDVRLANLDIQSDNWIILLDLLMIMMTVIQNASEVLYHLTIEILNTEDLPTMTVVHLPAITIVP